MSREKLDPAIFLSPEITKLNKMGEWIRNSYKNYALVSRLTKNPENLLENHLQEHAGQSCLVLGSGKTLDYILPYLRTWRGAIVCGPSQVKALMFYNLKPDFIVGYDSHPVNNDYLELRRFRSWYKKTTLITFPQFDPQVIAEYPGPKWFFRTSMLAHASTTEDALLTWKQFVEKYDPQPNHPMSLYLRDWNVMFLKVILREAYEDLPFVVPATGNTSNMAVLLADMLGFDNIFLAGVDYGYVRGFERINNYLPSRFSWQVMECPLANPLDPRFFLSDNGCLTNQSMVGFKFNLLNLTAAAIRAQVHEVIASTEPGEQGILDFYKYIHIKHLLEGCIPKPEDLQDRSRRANEWYQSHRP